MVPVRSRNSFVLLLLLGGLFGAVRGAAAGDVPPVQGDVAHFNLYETAKPAPDVPFTDGAGAPLTLADYRGKVLLVNFWATWCAPCVREMPELDALQAAMGGDRFAVWISVRPCSDECAPIESSPGLQSSMRAKRDARRGV